MPTSAVNQIPSDQQAKFLLLLQQLLSIPVTEVKAGLNQAGHLISVALDADKVDILVYDPALASLIAIGTSETPMSQRQRELGLDRLPIANGGRVVEAFQTGQPYINGRVDEDETVLPGFRVGLGIRSMVAMPLEVNGELRGCVTFSSSERDKFHAEQVAMLRAVTHWVGLVLHQAELVERIASDRAERARQGVAEELIAIMAHDLRNYLNPLTLGVQVLERRAQRDKREADLQTLKTIESSLGRLRKLVTDLLDASRLEHGLFALTLEQVNLRQLADETAMMLSTPQAPIRLQAREDVYVQADANRVRQALENLLVNAQQHTPVGVPVVMEVYRTQREGKDVAVLHIRDEGPGIAAELLPKLFTRFGAGKGSLGLGLGLYIAYGIANAHRGTLTVTSTPGEGASFCLYLPYNQEQLSEHNKDGG